MTETRNILLIGRTGGGKSTLGNVLINKNNNFEEVFSESEGSVSETKNVKEEIAEIDLSKDGSQKVRYRIIDTIGLGDTKLTTQGVLIRLAEVAGRVKSEGLNHILFVTQGRFSKEEIEAYDLLSSVIFDKDVLKYTTIVRTNFPSFEDTNKCGNDRAALRIENADLAHILNLVNIIYVDNPPLEGRPKVVEMNKETREESRKRLLTYLAGCQGTYRPSNIDTLDERVENYRTNEQLLKEKMKELEKVRKEQEEKFRQEIVNLKEEQARELRENRIKFEDDIHKVKMESEANLQKTKIEMTETHRKAMDEHDRKNEEKIQGLKDNYEQQTKNIKDEGERQKRDFEERQRRNDDKISDLQKKLDEKGSSSNDKIIEMWQQQRADDKAQEAKKDAALLKLEEKKLEADKERQKEEKASRERMEKIARKNAA
ncbi:hypothetical protein C1645_809467 [Glomus cerebriforme]|uniref:AIG1-type G domain-containing protein n=1 Tax=Glomus cerebriforme TaxID=658196 RepID=A0A397SBF2_9GLOM|nr:hypothetical protein C1645_809467 [Glomus cerebriforme]